MAKAPTKAPKVGAPASEHKKFAKAVLESDDYREPEDKSRKDRPFDTPDEDPNYRPKE